MQKWKKICQNTIPGYFLMVDPLGVNLTLSTLWSSLVAQLVKNPPAMWETWQPTPAFWPGESNGQTSLAGYTLVKSARPPCPSPTPGAHSNSRPSRWCSVSPSSVVPFSSCPQSLPASESFPMRQLFTWGGQSIGVSASASVLPMNTQDWSPLGWTGWTSLQSKGLSRVLSNTTIQKHQFFCAQLSSQPNSHIHTWPLEKP